jgi:hypothetical protein
MRSIEEFKKRQLETLPLALARPSMWCGHFGADDCFRSMLSDLCWIDNREVDWKRAQGRFLWGSGGVLGQLTDQPIVIPEYHNEVASSYSEIAHALGYFQPARRLSGSEWADLRNALDNDFFARDWHVEGRISLVLT